MLSKFQKLFWNCINIICMFLIVPRRCSILRTAQYINLPQYNDKYVGTGILWNTEVKNIYYCAIQCASYEKCVAFFYQKSTCSGYNKIIPAAEDLIPYVGKVFYQVQQPSSQDWCSGDRYKKDTDNGICYKAWDTQLSWSDAQSVCKGEGGDLAVLDANSKIDLLANIPEYLCSPGVFGPLINKCYWTTSTPLPRNASETVCIGSGSMLASSFPDYATYYIVLSGTGILQSTDVWWLSYNDMVQEGVLKTYNNQRPPWSNMVSLWGNVDADCMVISPADNFKWIERKCDDSYNALCEIPMVTDFWIGGKEETVDHVWQWTNGDMMDMTKWHSDQPGDSLVENCAVLKYDESGNKFANEDCSQMRNFICEKTIIP